MIEFDNTLTIARPVDEVFEFIANFENVPKWNYYVLRVDKLSDGAIGQGTLFHQVRKIDEQDYRITEYEPLQRVVVKTTPGSRPKLEREITLRAVPQGTQVHDAWKLETGRGRLVDLLGAGKVRAAVAENLHKLKELLETRRTRLQDGRTVQI